MLIKGRPWTGGRPPTHLRDANTVGAATLKLSDGAGCDLYAPARCPFLCNFLLGKQKKVDPKHKN